MRAATALVVSFGGVDMARDVSTLARERRAASVALAVVVVLLRFRGRPRTYGKNKLSLAKRAANKQGWQTLTCTLYGRVVTKTYKTFLATYRPAG